jgi:hypothetical protein
VAIEKLMAQNNELQSRIEMLEKKSNK